MGQVEINTKNENLDLKEIFTLLLEFKKWILTCTLFFAFVGALYAYNLQGWWTSNAVITSSQFENYGKKLTSELNILYYSYGLKIDNTNEYLIKKNTDSKKLFYNFIASFNSLNNKKEFILNSQVLKKYSNKRGVVAEEQNDKFINNWEQKISSELLNKKKSDIYKISFQSRTSKDSHNLLNEYVEFINKKVNEDTYFRVKSSLFMCKIISQYKVTPLNRNMKDIYLKEKPTFLNNIEIGTNINIESFQYLKNITIPVHSDKINRTRVVIFSIITGFCFAVALLFLRLFLFGNCKY